MVDSHPSTAPGPGPPARKRGGCISRALPRRAWTGLLLGALLRALLLPAALGQSFRCDEPAYRHLSRIWAEHGVYVGPWPPLHPALLTCTQTLFGQWAEPSARILMVLLAVWTGAWLAALARLAHSRSAAVVAAWIWALYLPLVPGAHVLLSEGLFLALLFPALTLSLRVAQEPKANGRGLAAVLASGILLGAACLTRESGLFWLLTLVPWAAHAFGGAPGFGLHRAALLLLAALATIAPWSVSASHSQGAFQLLGRTLGQNVYFAWNQGYKNFDLTCLNVPSSGLPGAQARQALLEAPAEVEHWAYEYLPDLRERKRVHLAKGLDFVRKHPVFVLRRSLLKASDLAAPLSLMTRFLRIPPGLPEAKGLAATGGYGDPLAIPALRIPLAITAVLSSLLLALLGTLGALAGNLRRGMPSLLLAAALSCAPIVLFIASSRFRLPFEVLLIVPAAAAIVDRASIPGRLRSSGLRASGLLAAITLLAYLWFLSLPTVITALHSVIPSSE